MPQMDKTRPRLFWVIGVVVIAASLLGVLGWPTLVQAGSPETAVAPDFVSSSWNQTDEATTAAHPQLDLACRTCHEDTTAEVEFPSGETLPALVDMTALAMSVHGTQAETPLVCTDCHQTVNDYQYPHTPVEAEDLQSYQIARGQTCERCHVEPHLTNHPDKEAAAPVTCTDCHGSHEVQLAKSWESEDAVDTCVSCHQQQGVRVTDKRQLTDMIGKGMFAKEVDNDYCLSCHSQPNFSMMFPSGDVKFLTVDEELFHASAHGLDNTWRSPFKCTDCHTSYQYPHQPVEQASGREYTISQNGEICGACHEQYLEHALDSVHGEALRDGQIEAAVCTDCHGSSHDAAVPHDVAIAQTCGDCHSTIYKEYENSIHGAALIDEGNTDVPTCIDCHGVHDINDPTTAAARARSPELCAECHANEELMAEYDISTEVFDTYVADFHGTTVMLFDYEHDDVAPNTAVCYDCHGVHDIKAVDDPNAGIRENLTETCRTCHPDASDNFADSWTSHYQPSLEHNPLIYLVELFYKIIIPATLGFFFFMIGTDVYRRIRVRIKKS